jgi:hypothetical protein
MQKYGTYEPDLICTVVLLYFYYCQYGLLYQLTVILVANVQI